MKNLFKRWLGIDNLELALAVQEKAIGEYLFWLGALTNKAKLSIDKLKELKSSPEVADLLLDYIDDLSMSALESASLSKNKQVETVVFKVRSKVGDLRKKNEMFK